MTKRIKLNRSADLNHAYADVTVQYYRKQLLGVFPRRHQGIREFARLIRRKYRVALRDAQAAWKEVLDLQYARDEAAFFNQIKWSGQVAA
jgi:hypothetical protein